MRARSPAGLDRDNRLSEICSQPESSDMRLVNLWKSHLAVLGTLWGSCSGDYLRGDVKGINSTEHCACFHRIKLRFIDDQCVRKIGVFRFIADLNRLRLSIVVQSPPHGLPVFKIDVAQYHEEKSTWLPGRHRSKNIRLPSCGRSCLYLVIVTTCVFDDSSHSRRACPRPTQWVACGIWSLRQSYSHSNLNLLDSVFDDKENPRILVPLQRVPFCKGDFSFVIIIY
jgi:hypothetical protein